MLLLNMNCLCCPDVYMVLQKAKIHKRSHFHANFSPILSMVTKSREDDLHLRNYTNSLSSALSLLLYKRRLDDALAKSPLSFRDVI